MKKMHYITLALLLIAPCIHAQALVITDTATTASVCYNTGTITVAASGGSGTYSFSIIAGPSYPNITYPIGLASQDSVFLTMPEGRYTIMVVSGGDTAYATATVAGNYTFPLIVNAPDTVYSPCITVSEQGGRPPFSYSISTTGTNSGFGPYQSSSSFCHLCDGHYWIRVMDSCSNIFTTNKITVEIPAPQFTVHTISVGHTDSIFAVLTSVVNPPYTYRLTTGSTSITNHTGIFAIPESCLPDVITVTDSCQQTSDTTIDIHMLSVSVQSYCMNGIVEMTIDSAAIGPFHITGSNGSLMTYQYGINFSSLPVDSPYHFIVTDSCGDSASLSTSCIVRDTNFFYTVCPWDSSIYISHDPVTFCYPVVLTCLNCSPVQSDTIPSSPARLFTHMDTGVTYTIVIKDQCGFDDTTTYTPHYVPLSVNDSIVSCRDFVVYTNPPVFTPPARFYLYEQGVLLDSSTMSRPEFYHLPEGTYQVLATEALCLSRGITVSLPDFGNSCNVAMFDSGCIQAYAIFQNVSSSTELFTLVDSSTHVSYTEYLPRPYVNVAVFDGIPVGNYSLVSDSGCSVPFVLPPFANYTITTLSTRQCTGQALIKASYSPTLQSCNSSQVAYFTLLKDNQYINSEFLPGGNTALFNVTDTGYYVIRLYMSNNNIFGLFNTQDTLCPLDTALVYVSDNAAPNVVAPQVFVCGDTSRASIPYTIFGGTAPYTVNILGYPTRTVDANADTFPNVSPGIYTMVVFDSCGISRSFSVSVIDTCSGPCTVASHFSVTDTLACAGAIISLLNQSSGATHYRWVINGNIYAYGADTSFYESGAGTYTIRLYAYIGPCADSSLHSVTIEDSLPVSGRHDTSLCLPVTLQLNTHQSNTLWSTGVQDSVISVASPGLYTAILSNACGSAYDTVNVTEQPGISGFSLTASGAVICEDLPDSVIALASIDSSGQPAVIFRWSNGVNDSAAYSSQVILYQAGTYQVTADNGFCPLTKDLSIALSSCDSECIEGLATPDIFSPNGDNKNDTFFILHICEFDPFEMHIYDRWGQLVFESTDIHKGWDGKYQGEPQPEGVYWMWAALTLPDHRTVYRAGTITLVR